MLETITTFITDIFGSFAGLADGTFSNLSSLIESVAEFGSSQQ